MFYYDDYLKFIKNERKTLRFISNQQYIRKEFNILSHNAEQCYYLTPNDDKTLRKAEFNFGSNFDIKIENEDRRVIIEVLVTPGFNSVSYVLSVCRFNVSPFTLIRKFHFDYAIPNGEQDPKPIYHLQYGGELSPQLRSLGIDVDVLHPWLSVPRISFYPINLALLLDLVFTEMRSEVTDKLVQRSEWRDFIKTNEDEILKPFYEDIFHFLNKDHSGNYLLRDYYYGKDLT